MLPYPDDERDRQGSRWPALPGDPVRQDDATGRSGPAAAAAMVVAGKPPNIILVGAGHAHVEVLRSFAEDPPRGIRLTLVTRSRHAYYSGMLPGLIAGLYRPDETRIDTQPLARAAGAEIVEASADGVDLATQQLKCEGRLPIPYDVLSFDIGSTTDISSIAGVGEHTVPVRPIDGFLDRVEALRQRALRASRMTRIAVVGGGAAGVELALSVANRLPGRGNESGCPRRSAAVRARVWRARPLA